MSDNVSMLTCGCAANAVMVKSDGTRVPACAIHDCDEVAVTPDFSDRTAKCSSCNRTQPSSPRLAFFGSRPDRDMDVYYCGCYGWD